MIGTEDKCLGLGWVDWGQESAVSLGEDGSAWRYTQTDVKPTDRVIAIDQKRLFRDVGGITIEFLGFKYFGRNESKVGTSPYAFFQSFQYLVVPFWFIVSSAAVLPLCWLLRGRQPSNHYRRKHGLCVGCGYDLSGTVNECPECGHAAPVMKPS